MPMNEWQAPASAMQKAPLLTYWLGQPIVEEGLISTWGADLLFGMHRLPLAE